MLAALVIFLYLPALFFDFTNVDDRDFVTKLPELFKDWANFGSIFNPVPFNPDSQGIYWRPMLGLSFWIDANLWGQTFAGWHGSNIVFHLIAVWLVFKFFSELGYRRSLALLASLVIAIHPALAQAVAWVPGRNDSLLAVFVLASLISLLNFLKRGSTFSAVMTLVWYLLALMTKETAIVLPLVALFLAKITKPKRRLAKAGRVTVWLGFAIASAIFLIVLIALAGQTSQYGNLLPQLSSYLADKVSLIILGALGKILLLGQLSPSMLLDDVKTIWGLTALSLLFLLVLLARRARKVFIAFGFSWFVLFLLPSSPPNAPAYSPALMDHRLWLPMVGLLIAIVETDLIGWLTRRRAVFLLSQIVLVAILSAVTVSYSRTFQNEFNWLKRVVKVSPSDSHGQFLVGVQLYRLGQLNQSLDHLQKAVALKPETRDANAHLGLVLLGQGKVSEAKAAFERELSFYPDSIIARSELERLSARPTN